MMNKKTRRIFCICALIAASVLFFGCSRTDEGGGLSGIGKEKEAGRGAGSGESPVLGRTGQENLDGDEFLILDGEDSGNLMGKEGAVSAWKNPGSLDGKEYLISTREDFASFIEKVRDGQKGLDAKLANDIFLNDITGWEKWEDIPPENSYGMIPEYEGRFDGDGYALIGYYSDMHPIFGEISEKGCLVNLAVRSSYFAALYENRDEEEDEVYVNPAAGLCGYNYGRIENCSVEGAVSGDGMAAGIAVYNGGVMENCTFSGSVEAGRCILREENELDIDRPRWRAGGIAAVNFRDGKVAGCVNYGDVILYADGLKTWRDGYLNDVLSETCAGGIVGKNNGKAEGCRNEGRVSCARTAGGIAGANSGTIEGCGNKGDVLLLPEEAHVTRLRYFENEERVAGGISGYNTGRISNCYHAGSARREKDGDPGYVFGIAQSANWVFDGEGAVENCYFLQGETEQQYRQYGTYKLSEEEMGRVEEYLYGDKALEDVEGFQAVYEAMDIPGTDEADYISLSLGPAEDEVYVVKEGDSLWKIAEDFYGDGTYYRVLKTERAMNEENSPVSTEERSVNEENSPVSEEGRSVNENSPVSEEERSVDEENSYINTEGCSVNKENRPASAGNDSLIYPGEKIAVPHLTWYLLRALGEREFNILETAGGNKGSRQASAFAKKEQAGWLYVYYGFYTAGEKGLSVLSKSKEECDTWLLPDAEPAIFSSCIFFSVTSNEAGDFFADGWEEARQSIQAGAKAYLGDDCWGIRFYRYVLDNGENLYGYSFRCYGFQPGMEEQQVIDCTVFYRMREGLLAEFIGVETHREDSDLFAATRYLAASVDREIVVTEEPVCECSEYLGREEWRFEMLHNPFALVCKK